MRTRTVLPYLRVHFRASWGYYFVLFCSYTLRKGLSLLNPWRCFHRKGTFLQDTRERLEWVFESLVASKTFPCAASISRNRFQQTSSRNDASFATVRYDASRREAQFPISQIRSRPAKTKKRMKEGKERK